MSPVCSADHQACCYGHAYWHAMIRALWLWQVAAWESEALAAQAPADRSAEQ